MNIANEVANILGFQPKAANSSPPSGTAPATPRDAANAAADDVAKDIVRLQDWRTKYPQAAKDLDFLITAFNNGVEYAKERVAHFPEETFGPFNVNKISVKRGYNADLLPSTVREHKGVLVLTVDTKKVDALVNAGIVDEQDVAAARTETPGVASVRGPKLLNIKP